MNSTTKTLTCLTCKTGYILVNNVCTPNCTITNCSICSLPNICANCSTNFTLNPKSNICIPNCGVDYCVSCTGSTCKTCLTNYTLLGSNCIPLCSIMYCNQCVSNAFDQCANCSTGFVPSSDKSACVQCDIVNCNSCNALGQCDSCSGSLLPMNGQCLLCNVDNCISCNANNTCMTCYEGYSLNLSQPASSQCQRCLNPCEVCYEDGSCLLCTLPYSLAILPQGSQCFFCFDPQCQNCSNSGPGTCTQCSFLYTLQSGNCVIGCPLGCSNCSSSTVCTECYPFFYLASNNTCQ